jgi:hypothetical protein
MDVDIPEDWRTGDQIGHRLPLALNNTTKEVAIYG